MRPAAAYVARYARVRCPSSACRGCPTAGSCASRAAASSSSASTATPTRRRRRSLLLHGWTASSDLQFFTAYEALAERCSFVGIDHRGHGRGLRSPDAFTLEDAADDAAAVVRHLGVGPVVAVGYSMGGPIALHLARRHPDVVAGVVVQATALEWSGTWRERALWRVLPIARLVAAQPRLPALPQPGRAQADRRRPPDRAVRAVAGQRDVPQRRVRDGRRRAGAVALRRPAVGVDARRAGGQPDHDARPPRAAVEAAGAGRRARRVAPRAGRRPPRRAVAPAASSPP